MHGESSTGYRLKLPPLEHKILMHIQLGVICTDMVDFCRSGHIYENFTKFGPFSKINFHNL